MISQQLNYIPVIIEFINGIKKTIFLIEGCEDEDGDPCFTGAVMVVKGMVMPKEIEQFNSDSIRSITKLKVEQENEI